LSQFSSQPGRHLIDGTVRAFLAGLLFPLTGIITAAFLTRRLGPEGYGLLVLSATLVVWIELGINSFFARATIKFVAEAEDWRSIGVTVSRLHFLTGVGGALLLTLLAFPLAALMNEPVLAPYLCLYSLHIPLTGLAQGYQNILVGIGHFKQKAVSSAGQWIARLVLIIVLVEIGLSIEGAILGSIGASLVEIAISRRYVGLPFFGHAMFPSQKFWNVGLILFLSGMSLGSYSSLGLVMLKTFGGTAQEVGIYGAAQNLSILPGIFSMAVGPLLFSTLSRMLSAGEVDQAKAIGRATMRMVLGLLPIAAMVSGAASEIVTLFFGQPFESAAPLFALLIWGAVAFVMITVSMTIVTAARPLRLTLMLSAPLLLLAMAGYWVMIPMFGGLGAAVVTALCSWLGAVTIVLVVYRLWSIFPPMGTLWRSVVVSVLAYALAVMWPTTGLLLLIKLAFIGIVIFLGYLILREFSADEIAQARLFLRRRTVSVEQPNEL
jgi:O-antigen/teichoic acid export membrane protein